MSNIQGKVLHDQKISLKHCTVHNYSATVYPTSISRWWWWWLCSGIVVAWQVVRSREGELIYLGTQSVLLQTGLLITRAEYPASPQHPVVVTGRVEFFDVTQTAAADIRRDEVKLYAVQL